MLEIHQTGILQGQWSNTYDGDGGAGVDRLKLQAIEGAKTGTEVHLLYNVERLQPPGSTAHAKV